MDAMTNSARDTADREIVITRVVNAPRKLVFEAWTDPKQVVQWWGPRGFTTTTHTMDVRPGGVWRFVMHGPDGRDYQNKITYVEIVKPERLVYTHGGDDDVEPVNFQTTVTFVAKGGKTEVTMRAVFPTAEERNRVVKEYGAVEGGKQTLERLDEHLASLAEASAGQDFVISRVFDAPRDLVWKACTEPERMAQWWGPKGFSVISSKMDLRPGGTYHYGLKAPDGSAMWGRFVFREIVAPERLVFITSFSDDEGGLTRHPMHVSWPLEMLSTFTFEDEGGKTKLTIRWAPHNASAEEQKTFDEGHAGMRQGWTGTLDQLAAYLAKA